MLINIGSINYHRATHVPLDKNMRDANVENKFKKNTDNERCRSNRRGEEQSTANYTILSVCLVSDVARHLTSSIILLCLVGEGRYLCHCYRPVETSPNPQAKDSPVVFEAPQDKDTHTPHYCLGHSKALPLLCNPGLLTAT